MKQKGHWRAKQINWEPKQHSYMASKLEPGRNKTDPAENWINGMKARHEITTVCAEEKHRD